MTQTSRRLRNAAVIVALVVAGSWLLTRQLKSPANLYDEGLILQGAERVLTGQVPYRDFWTLYAPGYFYALAALFKLTGPNLLAARLFDTILRGLFVVLIYLLARRMTAGWVALIPAAFATLWLGTIRFYSYPAFPATAALVGSVLLLSRYLDSGRRAWLAAAGAALGLTALLRLDFGGYAAVGVAAAVAVWELRRSAGSATARLMPVIGAELVVGAAAVLVALPLYGYVTIASGPTTVWEDLIVFPATTFRAARYLPVPPLVPNFAQLTAGQWADWVRLYLPLAVYGVALIASALWLRKPDLRTDPRPKIAVLLIALTLGGLGLVIKATSRYHELHALPTTFVASIVATALAYRLPRRLWRFPPFLIGFSGALLLLLGGPYVAHFVMLSAQTARYVPTGCYSSLERAGCAPLAADQEQAIAYVRRHVAPGEHVFVGNTRHDQIFVNDLLFNFLADRPSPTRYSELHPGLATTLPIQQAIVEELRAKQVRWVVTLQAWESREPNTSSISSGVTYLDDFIRSNYVNVVTLGNYRIWQRADSR